VRKVVTEAKFKEVWEDETRTAEAPVLVREHAKTEQPDAGWIYASDILSIFWSGMG